MGLPVWGIFMGPYYLFKTWLDVLKDIPGSEGGNYQEYSWVYIFHIQNLVECC